MHCDICGDEKVYGTITFRSGRRITPELIIHTCEMDYEGYFIQMAKSRNEILALREAEKNGAGDSVEEGAKREPVLQSGTGGGENISSSAGDSVAEAVSTMSEGLGETTT